MHQICIFNHNILAAFMRLAPNVQGAVQATVMAKSTSSHRLTTPTARYHSMTPNSVQVGDFYTMYFAEAIVSGLRMKFPKDRAFTFDIIYRNSSFDDVSQVKVDYILALEVQPALFPSRFCRFLPTV